MQHPRQCSSTSDVEKAQTLTLLHPVKHGHRHKYYDAVHHPAEAMNMLFLVSMARQHNVMGRFISRLGLTYTPILAYAAPYCLLYH